MAAGYKLLVCGVERGQKEEQVADALAPILKRSPAELLPALCSKQPIVLTLSTVPSRVALALFGQVKRTGCACTIDSVETMPPKAAPPPGNFDGLALRPFVGRTVGLALNAPMYWRDVSDKLFRIRHAGTSTYLASSMSTSPGVLLQVWAEFRFGVVTEKMAHLNLKPYGAPYSLDTSAGLAIAAEFRGTVTGDKFPTHQLVLCLRPESAAISLSITGTVPEFERHQALYQWLLRTQLHLCDSDRRDAVGDELLIDQIEEAYKIASKFNEAGKFEDAIPYFRKAAEQGHAEAQYALGCRYQRGEGVAPDGRQAFEWWRKSAAQGLPPAQFNLGLAYQRGMGTTPNAERAFYWYSKAAQEGEPSAQSQVAVCFARGEGVAQNDRQAIEWWRKAAEQGLAEAQYNLASRYENGIGTALDAAQAFHWYSSAARQGLAHAQYSVAACYVKGTGVAVDHSLAAQWSLKAAEQGHAGAQLYLGLMHERGEGRPKSREQAIVWYRKAAAQGSMNAKERLATLGV